MFLRRTTLRPDPDLFYCCASARASLAFLRGAAFSLLRFYASQLGGVATCSFPDILRSAADTSYQSGSAVRHALNALSSEGYAFAIDW
jgi:hypothetical protein